MRIFRQCRRNLQRGATLTGYALLLAAFTGASLGAIKGLETSSTAYLDSTGEAIGEPRPTKEELGIGQLTTGDPSISSPPSPPTYSPEHEGRLTAVHTITSANPEGLCIQPNGSNVIVQAECDGSLAQDLSIWKNEVTDTDQIRIGDKCLGLEDESVQRGVVVMLETCIDGDETQLWEQPSGTSIYQNVYSGKCLDVTGAGFVGAALIQWDCHGGNNQNWDKQAPWTPTLDPVLMVSAADATLTGAFGRCCSDDWISAQDIDDSPNTPGSGATATFEFTVADAGDYKIEGFIWAFASANSFWVTTSLGPEQYEWGTPVLQGAYDFVNTDDGNGSDAVITIPANTVFTITVWLREDYTWLKSLELVPV